MFGLQNHCCVEQVQQQADQSQVEIIIQINVNRIALEKLAVAIKCTQLVSVFFT